MGRIKEIIIDNEDLIEENRILKMELAFKDKLLMTIVYAFIAYVIGAITITYWVNT